MSEIGLIGKKIGMSREFFKTGQSIPVTVLKVEKGRIVQLINKEKSGFDVDFYGEMFYHDDWINFPWEK